MKFMDFSDVTRARVSKWIVDAKPLEPNTTWTERRQAIVFGGHTYLIGNGQVFQCAHCGHYDPQWTVTEVIQYFKEKFNVEPTEIEVTCSVAIKAE